MSLSTATYGLLIIYVIITLTIVIRGALKIKTMSDYAVGNIVFKPWMVGLSLAASTTSAATFIINPGYIALYGWSAFISFAVVLPIGVFLSLYFMTKRFREHGVTIKALTLSQWIGTRYNSKAYAVFFAFLSLLLITFIVLICVGLASILSKALNLDIIYVAVGIIVFVFGYMMFGGANSMVYTNTIQASIKLIVAFIMLGSGIHFFKNGFNETLSSIDTNLVSVVNPTSPMFRDFFEIFICQFIVGIAIVCQPHIITKSLLLKKDEDVNKYLTIGIIVLAIFFSVVFTGFYARLSFPDLMLNGTKLKMDMIIPTYVVQTFSGNIGVFVGVFVILGLMSSGIATLEGLIQSLSTTISSDIIKPLLNMDESETNGDKKLFYINRIIIVCLALISMYFSIQQIQHPKLSVSLFALVGVYGFFATAFVPILFGIFSKEAIPVYIPFSASIVALLTHFGMYYGKVTKYLQGPIGNPAVSCATALVLSFLTGLILLQLYKSKNQTKLPVS